MSVRPMVLRSCGAFIPVTSLQYGFGKFSSRIHIVSETLVKDFQDSEASFASSMKLLDLYSFNADKVDYYTVQSVVGFLVKLIQTCSS